MNNLKEWFDFGFGPKEFHQVVHVFWYGIMTYLIVTLPSNDFSLDGLVANWKTIVGVGVVTVLKSYVTPSQHISPPQ